MPRPRPERPRWAASAVVRRSLRSFVLRSLVVLVVVGLAAVWVARDVAFRSSVDDATERGSLFAETILGPLLTPAVLTPGGSLSPSAVTLLRKRVGSGTIRHLKLYDESGTVLWADQADLIGRGYTLDPELTALRTDGATTARLSRVEDPEDAELAGEERQLEIYTAVDVDGTGRRVLVETYWSMRQIDEETRSLVRAFLPLLLGALLLFQLAVLPLGLSLARRVDRTLADRERMTRHALSAARLERSRLAAQLHDGVIQDLAGIGFALPTIAAGLHARAEAARELVWETQRVLLRDVDALRNLLVDLHDDPLGEEGLEESVGALADRARQQGLSVTVAVDPGAASPGTRALALRTVREGLQNVLKHAAAEHAGVSVAVDGGDLRVRVSDDGRGAPSGDIPEGHVGLSLLRATLADVGGSLDLRGRSPEGSVLEARVPLLVEDALDHTRPHSRARRLRRQVAAVWTTFWRATFPRTFDDFSR
ncbi:sensor histidine kinase [Lapillicoccus jejuensis]|uniref:Histidine kinase/DNA gyrase B/HSP90-like ATPase n=1 Tax=Lapillicoccus jejuensis TaxID=402171 RepID=A0A542E5B1_9MICO|nr:ATP-binding protein [Lapillicoccus jejuensis]TQJ10507.1 histidine kinase/DNA gyrase B/HSP90-like ATPase [Lapillicoccus jejuensis]